MQRSQISVFTPSNTPPEVLERIFVQRHRLLEKIVDRLKRSMLTGDMHHALLIGPRGSGKTNMVTLTQHRLRQQGELNDVMRVAWLGEDDTITGLVDLALGIADRLAEVYPDEFETDYRSSYRGLPADDAAEAILNEVIRRLGHRYLLLLFENMDAAFKGLGDTGQKRWRAFLQEKSRIATLATSQQIFEGVSDRDLPFWGFFDIHHLSPLSFDDARALIRKISLENGNTELVKFLETADGRFRIRSLHHLAGGNHRMYVLLSEFLTKDSLDDLVSAFERLADELTPYFQERIRSLPAQQAKIVQSLAAMEGAAITVKEIAASTFIDERSCSKQLGELRNKRYVQSKKRGKESYYELAEPLMRLCLEVRNQRGKPLRLIARFLKAWFTIDDLKSQLSLNRGTPNRADAKTVQAQIDRDIETHLKDENYQEALRLAEELTCANPLRGRLIASKVKWQSGDLSGAITDLTSVIDMPNMPVDQKAIALFNRGLTYSKLGETEKEFADCTALIEMPDAPVALKAKALNNLGVHHWRKNKMAESFAAFEEAIGLAPLGSESRCSAMFALPEPQIEIGLLDEVAASLRLAFEQNDPNQEGYGGTPDDLLWMVLRRGSDDWGKYVAKLLPLYVEFGATEKLGRGLTRLIERLDEGDYTDNQLDRWNTIWQQQASDVEGLEIPLKCLVTATEAIKSKSDRPLFELPREVRSLVRSMLIKSLGEITNT